MMMVEERRSSPNLGRLHLLVCSTCLFLAAGTRNVVMPSSRIDPEMRLWKIDPLLVDLDILRFLFRDRIHPG